jgi:hypothetical protein
MPRGDWSEVTDEPSSNQLDISTEKTAKSLEGDKLHPTEVGASAFDERITGNSVAEKAPVTLSQHASVDVIQTDDDVDGDPVDEVDGKPIDNVDGEPIDDVDGEPIDDVDGEPIDDIDGEPVEDADGEPIDDIDGEPIDDVDGERIDNIDGEPVNDLDGASLDDGGFDGEPVEEI